MKTTLYSWLLASAAGALLCGCDYQPPAVAPQGEVTGRYVNLNGTPGSGTMFSIDGRTAVTDADGYFHFSSVPASYDLVWVTGEDRFTIYEGVTRRDPVVTYPSRYGPGVHWAEITGRVPHAAIRGVVIVSTSHGLASTTYVDTQTDAYFVDVPGDPRAGPQRVTVQAIFYASSLPATAATRSVPVGPGERVVVDFDAADFGRLPSTSVTVRAFPPNGTDRVEVAGRAILNGVPLPFGDYAPGGEAVLRFPRIPGLKVDVDLRSWSSPSQTACFAHVWGVQPETNPVELQLHDAPRQQAPADSARVDWRTELAWSPGHAGGVFQLSLASGDASPAVVTRYTDRSTVPIGEAAPAVLLDRPGWIAWHVAQTDAAQSVDELLQPGRTFEDNAAIRFTARYFTRAEAGAGADTETPARAARPGR